MGYVNPAVAAAGSRAAAQAIMDAAVEEMGGVSQTQEAQTKADRASAALQAPRLARTPPGAVPGEGVIPSSVRMARTPPTAGQPGMAAFCAVCQLQTSPSEAGLNAVLWQDPLLCTCSALLYHSIHVGWAGLERWAPAQASNSLYMQLGILH